VREKDPTTQTLFKHYAANYQEGAVNGLGDLIVNIMFCRNTMSKQVVKLCDQGRLPWLKVEGGRLSDDSKRDVDAVYLSLGGKVFFTHVEPMKSRILRKNNARRPL
jgi:hypothetical protein